jgi:hypothetical protein
VEFQGKNAKRDFQSGTKALPQGPEMGVNSFLAEQSGTKRNPDWDRDRGVLVMKKGHRDSLNGAGF